MLVNEWPNEKNYYYEVRSWDPAELSDSVRAARFIYLNRYCFNGLYRTNANGQFNVPYGGGRAGAPLTRAELALCSEMLQRAELVVGDFGVTLEEVKEGDFVYMDPPYQTTRRKIYGEYGPTRFSEKDLQRLRGWMLALEGKRVPFVVSYADSRCGERLAEGFHVRRLEVRRNIAGFAGKRKLARELVISNINPTG